jgi:hypothetical protein
MTRIVPMTLQPRDYCVNLIFVDQNYEYILGFEERGEEGFTLLGWEHANDTLGLKITYFSVDEYYPTIEKEN